MADAELLKEMADLTVKIQADMARDANDINQVIQRRICSLTAPTVL